MVPVVQFLISSLLTFSAYPFWVRVAQVDGRHALTRAPWVWGLVGAGWTGVCSFGWGHAPVRLLFDQLVVVVAMIAVVTIHDHQRARSCAP